MAKTGPQRYPGASTAYWWQTTWGGSPMESNVGVVHTTEGYTVPLYSGGSSAPNFTALPDIPARKLRWYQHFDFDVSSRALVNLAGGVETNTANAVQIELVGTCDERHATTWDGKQAGVDYIFWPDAPDWLLAELALFVKWAHDQHGIPLRSTVTWKPYNKGQVGGSYGSGNGVRLTNAQWNAYYGWLGHQHVPENQHGDPGDLDFARVLAHATGVTSPSPEEDMTPEQAKQLDAIYRNLEVAPWRYKNEAIEQRDAYAILRGADANASKALAGLVTLAAKVDALTPELTPAQLEALAAQIGTSPTLGESIAELVATKLAARLAE